MLFRRLAVFCLGALFAVPVFADVACSSGNLSGLVGTTCDIGSLQFTFQGLYGANYTYDSVSSSYMYGTAKTASDFTFTAFGDGFSLGLTGNNGISLSGPGGNNNN